MKKPAPPRLIVTEYYDHRGRLLLSNRAVHANQATLNAVGHLQTGYGKYGDAFCAVVYDEGYYDELHSVITMQLPGLIEISLVRDPKKPILLTGEPDTSPHLYLRKELP